MFNRLFIVLCIIICVSCTEKEKYIIVENNRLIAHRGYWNADTPPNTISSIKKAIESGFFAAEIDIQETKDSILIIYHDDFLNDRKISDLSYSDILELHKDFLIPTLKDCLDLIKLYPNFHLLLDLKKISVNNVNSCIVSSGVGSQILYSSFYYNICKELVYLKGNIPALLISEDSDIAINEYVSMGLDGLVYRSDLLNTKLAVAKRTMYDNLFIISWVIDPKNITDNPDIDFFCVDIDSYLN